MRHLLLATVFVLALPAVSEAACTRAPLRRATAVIVERQPVRSFFRERQPARRVLRGLGRVLLGDR